MGTMALTLPELASALEGEIVGGFAIIDRVLYDGIRPPYRTIEFRANSWNGDVLGSLAEYPTTDHPLHFVPMATIHYGTLAPVIDALESHGVVIEEPSRG